MNAICFVGAMYRNESTKVLIVEIRINLFLHAAVAYHFLQNMSSNAPVLHDQSIDLIPNKIIVDKLLD